MKLSGKYIFLIGLLFFSLLSAHAQKISTADRKVLVQKEDSLQSISDSMINAENPAVRFRSDSNFVRTLIRALKVNYSFYYPFDSVATVSRQVSPDSSFRIFTWQLKRDEYMYLQKGAIQINTPDGSLKLFPLFDISMFTGKPLDSVRTRSNWIGAVYYKIILKEYNNKKYYTLLGFDDFSVGSNRKWLEVLTFNEQGEPQFGGPYVSFKGDTVKKPTQQRFNIEYKKEARTTLNYNPEMDMIIYDHLISETDEPSRKDTYIPDGDFEGFKWDKGQWVHVDKVFNFTLKDGQSPVEQAILDKEGKFNEEKLIEQSIKNQGLGKKEETKPPVKKKISPK
ncbi:MAG: hypothetical protein INR73_14650 [Williamsia sp.]|nr:hypothetical protein [Williamsia sp.]